MTTIAFDTLAYVKTLRDAGIPEPQAKAQTSALVAVLKSNTDELATKQDLRELELRLNAHLKTTKSELLKWVIGLFLTQAGLFAALVKLLH